MSQFKENAVVLHQGTMKDWRFADQTADELTALQSEPWDYQVVEGPYGGIMIDFVGPDGSKRSISVEVDKGNIHATTSAMADENHVILKIGLEATMAEASSPKQGCSNRGVLFGPDGMEVLNYNDIDPGCLAEVKPEL